MQPDEPLEPHRAFLTRFAYRMLGSVQDAEDAVQDAHLRWEGAGRPVLDEPRIWFTRVVARLCLDHLRRTRTRREVYEGEWLPEPWQESAVAPVPEADDDPDAVSAALLAALHRLGARERAVFLLHDVFGYTFAEAGAILELRADHCRQLAVRARGALGGEARRPRVESAEEERLAAAFFRALRDGDIGQLVGLLHEGVTLTTDGGGKASAVRRPLEGRAAVVRFFERLFVRTGALDAYVDEGRTLHGGPARLVWRGTTLESVFMFDVQGGRIARVLVQRNPDKLGGLAPMGGRS